MKLCGVEGCTNKVSGRGICRKHFILERDAGTLRKNWPTRLEKFRAANPERYPGCIEDGCDLLASRRGLCDQHFLERQTAGTLPQRKTEKWFNPDGTRMGCAIPGCPREVEWGGLCASHYSFQKNGKNPLDWEDLKICPSFGCGRTMRPSSQICKRCNQFRWRYGLTVERVLEVYRITTCENPGCENTENLHLDHDHSCCPPGKFPSSSKVSCGECIRGRLCASCNKALGSLQENPRRIGGLLEYLGVH